MTIKTTTPATLTPQEKLSRDFHAARKRGVPIVVLTTADQWAALDTLTTSILADEQHVDEDKQTALLVHDCIHGLTPAVDKHARSVKVRAAISVDQKASESPVQTLAAIERAEQKDTRSTVLFMLNAQRHFIDMTTRMIQAVSNVRQPFKKSKRLLVLLTPEFTPPKELEHDVIMLDVPLPGEEALRHVVNRMHENAKLSPPTDTVVAHSAIACAGLSEFAAEQNVAMSLTTDGIDQDALWERKRKMVRQTPGLSVWQGRETFATIGGLSNIKQFLTKFGSGPNRPNGIVFIDEIEKDTAGMKGDNTGIAQKQHKALLTELQDTDARGILLDGQPGAGKTTIAKAYGNELGIPTIALNLGDVQGSLVGQSEELMRNALKTIRAVCQGKALWIATCNDLSGLSPELRGRFKNGTFFFDLPTEEERDTIWRLYLAKYGIKANAKRPDDGGWVGREIEACCDQAYSLGCSILEASKYIVPQAKAMREKVDERRRNASGRIISASYDGVYDMTKLGAPDSTERQIEIV